MTQKPFGLLELGSNSLKLYRVKRDPRDKYSIDTHKILGRIAHAYH